MKKIISGLLMTLAFVFFSSGCFAADWGLVVSKVAEAKHYLLWKVVATSNGSALSATDLVGLMQPDLKTSVQGTAQRVLTVSPGTDSVAPDTTIDVTFSNAQGIPIFVHAGYSNTADTTGIALSEDYGQFPPIFDKFYLTLNDIGTAGDQVTLYIEAWIETIR